MSDHVLHAIRKFVSECEFESTQEAVEAGFGVIGWEIMIVFHPLYDQYVLSKQFLMDYEKQVVV